MKETHTEPLTKPVEPAQTSGIARRRLLRAGLAAAPVLAAMKSNTVLAGQHTCIKPSSFSSLKPANWKISRGRTVDTSYTCFSPDDWKIKRHPSPYSNKSKSFFQAVHIGAPPKSVTAGFGGTGFSGKTLQDILEMNGTVDKIGSLARHLVASFLTAVENGNNTDTVLLTTSQCITIWNNNGAWSPAAGMNWTLADTMDYFEKIYGPAFPITSL